MFVLVGGVIRILLGGYVAWIFGNLGIAAIRDKEFRIELRGGRKISYQ